MTHAAWNALMNSLAAGAAYVLIGLSFTVVFNSSKAFNFAVGHHAVLGALLYVSLSLRLPPWLSALLALLLMAAIGAVTYLFGLRRPELQSGDPLTVVIITLGLGVVLENAAHFLWGVYALQAPPLVPGAVSIGGLELNWQRVFIIGSAVFGMVALWLFQRHTLIGKALVAVGFHRQAAAIYGVNDRMMQTLAWALGLVLAGLAGILFGPLASVSMALAFPLSVKGFAVALIGGLGSGAGILIGGLGLGVLETLVGLISPGFTDVATFSLLFIFLLVRPAGLLGDAKALLGPRA